MDWLSTDLKLVRDQLDLKINCFGAKKKPYQ